MEKDIVEIQNETSELTNELNEINDDLEKVISNIEDISNDIEKTKKNIRLKDKDVLTELNKEIMFLLRKDLELENDKLENQYDILEELEKSKEKLESADNSLRERITQHKSSLNIFKEEVKVAIAIRNIGWFFYSTAFVIILGTILATLIQNNFDLVQRFIHDIQGGAKLLYFFCIILIVEGGAIARKSTRYKDVKAFYEKDKNVKIKNVLTRLSFNDLYFGLSFILLLFFPDIFISSFSSSWGFLALSILSSLLIAVLILHIIDFVKLIIDTFNDAIEDPKDRILALIAAAGTVISVIALFK
ncbi:coiled-coil domain-containing protein [Alkalibacterium putridalgicola]|uniref:coiled-coil domain-containing protein n=1 Tax=Alkalibacterium putridalgicola TaxID=426703 RepID=UPI0034CEBC54